jgi:hypothetical protein
MDFDHAAETVIPKLRNSWTRFQTRRIIIKIKYQYTQLLKKLSYEDLPSPQKPAV